MSALLLSAHVVLAVLAVGPVTAAVSLFRPAWRAAAGRSGGESVALLHRITRTCAGTGLAVPDLDADVFVHERDRRETARSMTVAGVFTGDR